VEVVILGEDGDSARAALLREAHRVFHPGRVVAGGEPGLLAASPLFAGRGLADGKATAYLCRAYTCERPTNDPAELASQLQEA
jgi:uncharacterized protein YyaL (SSP411 family)